MPIVHLPRYGTFDAWRRQARALLERDVPQGDIEWRFADDTPNLLDRLSEPATKPEPDVALENPRKIAANKPYLDMARAVICHQDLSRFTLLYELLARLQHNRSLMADRSDAQVDRAAKMAKSVRRDCHKMTAFVRFREVGKQDAKRRQFYAWFEPDHHIVERTSTFFTGRFADMDWRIATPKGCVDFHKGRLSFSEPQETGELIADETDELWKTYYASIFNPARVKVKAMQAEMPKKYWKNLPEAALIPELIAGAEAKVREMREKEATQPPVFAQRLAARRDADAHQLSSHAVCSISDLKAQLAICDRCALHCAATQAVGGEGPDKAELMFVGEQPGDREDIEGRPFVGPAGQVFDMALAKTGFDRANAYVTNAVKHFKYTTRGKRRIHMRPNAGEIQACRRWLEQEIEIVRPKLIVAMGATAAEATTGNGKGILARRGTLEETGNGVPVFLTIHPSAILRMQDPSSAAQAQADFEDDLKNAVLFSDQAVR